MFAICCLLVFVPISIIGYSIYATWGVPYYLVDCEGDDYNY